MSLVQHPTWYSRHVDDHPPPSSYPRCVLLPTERPTESLPLYRALRTPLLTATIEFISIQNIEMIWTIQWNECVYMRVECWYCPLFYTHSESWFIWILIFIHITSNYQHNCVTIPIKFLLLLRICFWKRNIQHENLHRSMRFNTKSLLKFYGSFTKCKPI